MTTILMIAALVLIAGLFLWLSTTAQPTQIAVVEEPDSAADADAMDGDVADVTLAEFATGPQGFQSLSIRLRDVAVASTLGARNFWIQLPNNRPYLIGAWWRSSTPWASGRSAWPGGPAPWP
jgi:hypothetical protein